MKKQILFFIAFLTLISCTKVDVNSSFNNFSDHADPVIVGNVIAARFLELPHTQYGNPLRIEEPRTHITYPDVCTWLGGLWFSKATQNETLYNQLEARFKPLLAEESYLQPQPNHVDNNVFGTLPLEFYLQKGNDEYKKLGMMYADTQWELPNEHTSKEANWDEDGYSWQTRIWIDDMFMITAIQAQAYRASNDLKYIDRAAKEMVLYLDSIQLDNGLFYHAPEAPFCWGRGNGWMAVGMAELLRILPKENEYHPVIMEAYLKMMDTLKKHQNQNGMWLQIIDDPSMWEETSGSAMFTYAMIVGVKKGWLDKKEYGTAARKAWLSLVTFIEDNGDVRNVCEGTNIGFTTDYYRNRLPLTGDLHGLAPILWCAFALTTDTL